jgi:hypothetical protein
LIKISTVYYVVLVADRVLYPSSFMELLVGRGVERVKSSLKRQFFVPWLRTETRMFLFFWATRKPPVANRE